MFRADRDGVTEDELQGVYELLSSKYRVAFMYGAVMGINSEPARLDSFNATFLVDQLWAMALEDPKSPIVLFIDTPGGDISEGLRIIDTIKTIPCPVWTVGKECFSMGAFLLAAGEPGHRYMMPNGETMLHLPSGMMGGDSKQLDIYNKRMKRMKDSLVALLQENGVTKTSRTILKDIDREFFQTAEESIKYGLADKVLDTEFYHTLIANAKKAPKKKDNDST